MDAQPITVEMLAPFLTDRGRIEVDFALQVLHGRQLAAELERLRSETLAVPDLDADL